MDVDPDFITLSHDTPFDFGWMGYTQNMQELGKVQDSFSEVAQETFAKWQKTTDCSGQSLFRVIEARTPQSTFYQDQVGYMSISSCSIIDGKSTRMIWRKMIKFGTNITMKMDLLEEFIAGGLHSALQQI